MSDKMEKEEVGGGGGARFAYDGIDRVIHEKARLSIVASLASRLMLGTATNSASSRR